MPRPPRPPISTAATSVTLDPNMLRYGLGGVPAGASRSPRQGGASPIGWARGAFEDFQNGPPIARPNLAQSFIPVIGPAWEAVADLQDGNYEGAAFNGAMAIADALPVGVAFKGVNAARKGVGILKKDSLTANASQKLYRARGMVRKGEETHHTVPLAGTPRNVPNWRNHNAFLKALPQETHQRLTRSWNGKPKFDPIRRVWYGTTDWMKAAPTGLAGYSADAVENLNRPYVGAAPGRPRPTR